MEQYGIVRFPFFFFDRLNEYYSKNTNLSTLEIIGSYTKWCVCYNIHPHPYRPQINSNEQTCCFIYWPWCSNTPFFFILYINHNRTPSFPLYIQNRGTYAVYMIIFWFLLHFLSRAPPLWYEFFRQQKLITINIYW